MATRATKRGDERTSLDGSRDVLICGASFAGLMVARELAGSGADVLVVDRYEIGERQTSACAIPTACLENLGLLAAEKQRFRTVLAHTAHGSTRLPVPWEFSTFDYRTLCELLWADCDAEFETAKVNGREPGPESEPIAVDTDRGVISAPLVVDAMGWKRILASGSAYQPPDAPLSRGLEVHPAGSREEFEIIINRRYVPAGYAWSFPADDELRVGVGSFDPRFHVRPTTETLAEDVGVETVGYQGNWIPHKLRPAIGGGVFFAGDSAGHCLPLTAEGIRPALYFGAALGRELRAIGDGRQTREGALAGYEAFNRRHQRAFDRLLTAQRILPRFPHRTVRPILATAGIRPIARYLFNRYLDIAPPGFLGPVRSTGPGTKTAAMTTLKA
ncbi:MAG: NAD(P)/FAD-dependent oxidoreductase [Solirubrobacterales bacterium]|nr:NAD(P)/FAD-dependent oxidoreductase [Solirubrobacterales bacterium]